MGEEGRRERGEEGGSGREREGGGEGAVIHLNFGKIYYFETFEFRIIVLFLICFYYLFLFVSF